MKNLELEKVKSYVERNKNYKWISKEIEERGAEEFTNLLYNCWLNTDTPLNDATLDNIFFFNFLDFRIFENDKQIDDIEKLKGSKGFDFCNILEIYINSFRNSRTPKSFWYEGKKYTIKSLVD